MNILLLDALFLLLLVLTYLFVARRRARMAMLVDHLEAMARHGLPIQTGLRQMAKDLGGALGGGLEEVADSLDDGASLTDALAISPQAVPPYVRRMVCVGEQGGNLVAFLGEARKAYRRTPDPSYPSSYAFMYPLILTSVVLLYIGNFFLYLFPQFTRMLEDYGVIFRDSAALTVIDWCAPVLLFFILLLAGVLFLGNSPFYLGVPAPRTMKGWVHRLLLRVPVLGGLIRTRSLQGFAVSTGLLLRAGARLPDAVRMASDAEPNSVLRRRYARLATRLAEGEPLSEASRHEGVSLPSEVEWFMKAGEAAGNLGDYLVEAGAFLDAKIRYAARRVARVVIPLFVLLNGGLVLMTCLSVALPWRDLVWRVGLW